MSLRSKIVYMRVDQLKSSSSNARVHGPAQLARIENSIRELGFLGVMLIAPDGSVVVGNARLVAAIRAGLTELPCVIISHLSEAELRAYMIADNQLATMSRWDPALLSSAFIELQGSIDLELTGFDQPEIDAIQFEVAERKTSTPDADDFVSNLNASPPVSRLDDMWRLGRHMMVQGDAKDPKTYQSLMWGPKAAAAFMDPPFNLPAQMISGKGKIKHRDFFEAAGEMSELQFIAFLTTIFNLVSQNLVGGAVCFVMSDWRHLREMLSAGDAVFSELLNLCVWMKANAGMGSMYRSQHELVLVWKHATAAHVNNIQLGSKGRNRSNVWQYRGANGFGADRAEALKWHPTVKPVAMVMDAIRDVTKRGDVVMDVFGGSGTTLIAAEKTGRIARLIEIDAVYCDVTIRRYQDMTGESVFHAASNRTFEDIEIERNHQEER